MSDLGDYRDREYDVVAYHGARASGQFLTNQALADASQNGEICTGIVKLAQLWLLEFLTPLGSIPYKPHRGCQFMTDLYAGQTRTQSALIALFALSEFQIRTNLRAEELVTDPEDERYRSAALLGTIITGDSLALRVEVRSVADTAIRLILPVDVLV